MSGFGAVGGMKLHWQMLGDADRRRFSDMAVAAVAASLPWSTSATGILIVVWLISLAVPRQTQVNGFDVAGFGRLPINWEGRVQPIETMARNTLLAISGKSQLRHDGQTLPAVDWLLRSLAEVDNDLQVFRIDDPDLKGMLGYSTDRKMFSARELFARIAEEHPGTPWAVQSKREGVVALGLEWQPYSVGRMTNAK